MVTVQPIRCLTRTDKKSYAIGAALPRLNFEAPVSPHRFRTASLAGPTLGLFVRVAGSQKVKGTPRPPPSLQLVPFYLCRSASMQTARGQTPPPPNRLDFASDGFLGCSMTNEFRRVLFRSGQKQVDDSAEPWPTGLRVWPTSETLTRCPLGESCFHSNNGQSSRVGVQALPPSRRLRRYL